MKLIIQDGRIVGTATDDYKGPMQFLSEPDGFDASRMSEYRVVEGVLVIPSLPFAKQKEQAFRSIDEFHAQTVQRLVGNPTQAEKDTWAMKLEAANALSAGKAPSTAGAAFVKAAGIDTPEKQSAWSASVLTKSADYASIVGLAEKIRTGAREAVRAAEDVAGLRAALAGAETQADEAVKRILTTR
jgi:hypothetical protein